MATPSLDRPASPTHPPASTRRPRMLRVSQVAELLDLPEQRVRILAREGVIPRVKVGRQVRFNEAELEAWIAGGGAGYPGAEE